MKSLTRRMMVLAIAASPLALAACSDDSDSPTAPSAGTAQVRVAHLSPDAPAVDVYVNGSRAVSGAAFKDVTGYLPVPAGSVNLRVTPAGATSPAVIDATVSFNAGGSYTVAATGLLAGIQPLVLQDDRGTTSQAKVLCTLNGLRAWSVLLQRGQQPPVSGFGARSTSAHTSQPIRPLSAAIGTRALMTAPSLQHPTGSAGQRHGWR